MKSKLFQEILIHFDDLDKLMNAVDMMSSQDEHIQIVQVQTQLRNLSKVILNIQIYQDKKDWFSWGLNVLGKFQKDD